MNWTIKTLYVRYFLRGLMQEGNIEVGKEYKLKGLVIHFATKQLRNGMRVQIHLRPESTIVLSDLVIHCEFPFAHNDSIFCNGYQSWTESREFAINEKLLPLRKIMHAIKMHRYGDIHFYPYSGKSGEFHSHTYTYIRKSGLIYLAGSLTEKDGYTIFQYHTSRNLLKIIKDCKGLEVDRSLIVADIVLLYGDEQFVFDEYFSHAKLTSRAQPTTGWTSWYNYYTKISENIILENVRALFENKVPIDIVQIDDGYQTAVGDWLSIKPVFPSGMKKIASEIHRAGYQAGLWLAPFICEKKSTIFAHKKNWLVKDENGIPIEAGWNPLWSGNFYALDIYNDQVKRYLEDVFNTVLRDWNFDMVKLDFLYAAAIIPRKGKSRGKIMRDAMELLRSLARGKKILGCGVPLGSAFGEVEYCRIGGDVALKWEDVVLKFMRYRERVDTKHSLTCTIHRRHLQNRAFLNDPDVFILRDENNSLSFDEKNTLFILNNIFGGLVFISDNIANYSSAIMRQYLSHFPLRNKTIESVQNDAGLYTIHFTIGSLSYVAFTNMSDEMKKFVLPNGIFFQYDPYRDETQFIVGDSPISLSPHQTQCLLKISSKIPSIAGTTGHIFPGSEIEVFSTKGKNFTIKSFKNSRKPIAVYIRVPKLGDYFINGEKCRAEQLFPTIYVLKTMIG
ncbi:MAG: alpha-galactosidase [Spirochaetes bacterium]|nr:alpha-galactosidase [Spirochaetota bacterium]